MTEHDPSENDALFAAFRDIRPGAEDSARAVQRVRQALVEQAEQAEQVAPVNPSWWRSKMNARSYTVATALTAVLAFVSLGIFLWVPLGERTVGAADNILLVPEGGRLDALDEAGQLLGPCPLQHTDVDVQVAGHFSRVTVRQHYHNPYEQKIEAVYTFPLSHRAAVDRMTMTIGDRVVQGEVKERQRARQIYEAARAQGYVASLLEQERPNIFTQSVANIEPGAEVTIEIAYVETVESVDGQYRFQFPMVVAPRYIPGQPSGVEDELPPGVEPRRGVVLLGPAEIDCPDGQCRGLATWLPQHARPIADTSPAIDPAERSQSDPRYRFQVVYADGRREPGAIFDDGLGLVGGRWFFCPPRELPEPGEPFSPDTDQVPDASRITPMPVRPDQRAGHDIDVKVTIDTGGPGITHLASPQHAITGDEFLESGERPRRVSVALKNEREIPNRDFLLTWRQTGQTIQEAVFTHTGEYGEFAGGFFTLILQPPERVADEEVRARELIFVLDSSGSMAGFSIESAKKVIRQAIDTMRPNDRFNIISFNNTLDVLWPRPQPNTADNRALAQHYIDQRQGGGGTEMRNAVFKALEAGPFAPDAAGADDGDQPMRIVLFVTDGMVGNDDQIIQTVREHSHRSRMFTIGMSGSPNRYLLDEMARAGRGAVDYALPHEDVEPIVQRFADRIATPVLTDIKLDFDGLDVFDVLPSKDSLPDLFDVQPLVLHGRYREAGSGTLTIRGRTGAGRYERTIELELPRRQDEHRQIATLWARQKVGELMRDGKRDEIVTLGESFQITTQHTSFVAVEKHRVTIGGEPRLVRVPIEFPRDMSWEGIFGGDPQDPEVVQAFEKRLSAELRSSQRGRESEVRAGIRLDLFASPTVPAAEFEAAKKSHQWFSLQWREPVAAPSRPAGTQRLSEGVLFDDLSRAEAGDRLGRGDMGGGGMGGMGGGMVGGGFRYDPGTKVAPEWGMPMRGTPLGLPGPPHIPLGETWNFADVGLSDLGRIGPLEQTPGIAPGRHALIVAIAGGNASQVAQALDSLFIERAKQVDEPPAEPLARVVADPEGNYLVVLMARPLEPLLQPYLEQLAAEKLDEQQRAALIEKLARELDQQLPSIRRELRLRGLLDESLYELLAGLDGDQTDRERLLKVSVLLNDLRPGTLRTLGDCGLTVDDTVATARFVVGQVRLAELERLARHPAVRRIEQYSTTVRLPE